MFWLPTLVVVLWCVLGARILRSLRSTIILRANQPPSPLESFPSVSVIVAARNEEEELPDALESLLALDYPDFEVVLVDDDSRDQTGAIADEWASKPAAVSSEGSASEGTCAVSHARASLRKASCSAPKVRSMCTESGTPSGEMPG